MQSIKSRSTTKTMLDIESNPSAPSGLSQSPRGRELQPMATPKSCQPDTNSGGPFVENARGKDSKHPYLYTDEDVLDRAPKGWPAIASHQMFYPNAGIHRKFSNLMQRILVSFQVELDCLEQKLFEIDKADEPYGTLGLLPFDRDEFLDRCCGGHRQQQTQQRTATGRQHQNTAPEQTTQHATPIQQNQHIASNQRIESSLNRDHREERTHLMDNAKSIFKEYHHFINMNNDFQSMRRVSRKQHLVHYLKLSREQLPSRDAHQYLWARDDFVNTDRDTVHQWFESILYSTWPWVQVSQKLHLNEQEPFENQPPPQRTLCILLPCFYKREKNRRPAPDGTGSEVVEYHVRVRRLRLLQKLILTFASAVMLLIPVSLLHFYTNGDRDRDRLKSFVIACISTVVFVVVITCLETNYGRALVGLCAFVAVLASFLANLSGASR
ncbi:hypothetical protein PG997_013749 [Apiospora hydei]|uniref:DUF6594 domain-containing protein n=1 Tax=Apiospora hydei TaxID=1337664 RepID=A0ABR1V740_9PEZI